MAGAAVRPSRCPCAYQRAMPCATARRKEPGRSLSSPGLVEVKRRVLAGTEAAGALHDLTGITDRIAEAVHQAILGVYGPERTSPVAYSSAPALATCQIGLAGLLRATSLQGGELFLLLPAQILLRPVPYAQSARAMPPAQCCAAKTKDLAAQRCVLRSSLSGGSRRTVPAQIAQAESVRRRPSPDVASASWRFAERSPRSFGR
jgi:hypothetical protein